MIKMSKRRPDRPTERELDILNILWTRGPSTNRDVHEALAETAKVRQTTTLNMLQIMIEKGWVVRDDRVRPQIYRANITRQKTQRAFFDYLKDVLFEGSPKGLITLFLSKASKDEVKELERWLSEQKKSKD